MTTRRSFLQLGTALGLGRYEVLAQNASFENLQWRKAPGSDLFTQVFFRDQPLVGRSGHGLLTASCRREGASARPILLTAENPRATSEALECSLRHSLRRAHDAEDVLIAELIVRNTGSVAQAIFFQFETSAHPFPDGGQERAYLPLSAMGLDAEHSLMQGARPDQLKDCDCAVNRPGEDAPDLICHYLEPAESDPTQETTKAPLLIPCVHLSHPAVAAQIALMASPLLPWRFAALGDSAGDRRWSIGGRLRLEPGAEATRTMWMYVHGGRIADSWKAFHTLAQQDSSRQVSWLETANVHYYDFLSPDSSGKRGAGFDVNTPKFRDFHIGLATQHGYYSGLGDYVHPDRSDWKAMPSDVRGPAAMSLSTLRSRIANTRKNGAKAAIYMHQVALDSAVPIANKLEEARLMNVTGKPASFYWRGPDSSGRELWQMSIASPIWQNHFLQQAQWIMELLDPDAIVVDESFFCLGYDYSSGKRCALSTSMIPFQTKLRGLVKSYGTEKAVFTSDCSYTSFVMWADGEAGDHENIYHPEYRQAPVRYTAALGPRRWLPCLWRGYEYWDYQMDLYRKTGSGLAIGNGWIEYDGLTTVPPATKQKVMEGITQAVTANHG